MQAGAENNVAETDGDVTANRSAATLADGFIESFERRYPRSVLETLLADRTTGKNIIWADGEYEQLGEGYAAEDEITCEAIAGTNSGVIKPRVLKEQERQSKRTKARAEVFTPSWLVNEMANALDEDWFRHEGTFTEEQGNSWEPNLNRIEFPKSKGRGWHDYVSSTRLEITCGEAPFLCSRYDTVTGEALPVSRRIGVLDRKLRVVSERVKTYRSWAQWALVALKSTYGYEYQGDSLLIARINCLETFVEHCIDRWGVPPKSEDVHNAAWVISWNLWQMNGLTCAVPTTKLDAPIQSTLFDYTVPEQEPAQMTLFDMSEEIEGDGDEHETVGDSSELTSGTPLCVIYDWENDQPVEFSSMKGEVSRGMKKFYAVIGNPPYQEEVEGNQRSAPIYNSFMDAAFSVGERVELITPARFLFNAGQTPKAWNKQMLADPHLKVLAYEADGTAVFSGVDIKGGVCVTLHDTTSSFGPIDVFTSSSTLNDIVKKVGTITNDTVLSLIAHPKSHFNLDESLYNDHPELSMRLTEANRFIIDADIFNKIPEIFADHRDASHQIEVYGRQSSKRISKFISAGYIRDCPELHQYKVLVAGANGSGKFGEPLSSPFVCGPESAHTQTYMNFGGFSTEREASACLKYMRTRFLRCMLSVLKVTQNNPKANWSKIPLQDFTPTSDIDWSQSVANIDQQLYRKYGLSQDEIDFIETHVKEMD